MARRRTARATASTSGTNGSRQAVSRSRHCFRRATRRSTCGRAAMATLVREPGTYRTSTGILVHSRALADGTIHLEREDGATYGRMGGEELVKLSDDPNWPDWSPDIGDPQLFAD